MAAPPGGPPRGDGARSSWLRFAPWVVIGAALLVVSWLVLGLPATPSEPIAPLSPTAAEPVAPTPQLPKAKANGERVEALAADVAELAAAPKTPESTQPGSAVPSQSEEPLLLHIVVVDRQATPVPDALVRVWENEGALDADQPALSESHSNGVGRVMVSMPASLSVLVAERPDVGSSGVKLRAALASSSNLDGETPVVLNPQAHVTGVVLEADDRPAAGVLVHSYIPGGDARTPPQLRTDSAGRFSLEVGAGAHVGLYAVDGERRTPEERLWLKGAEAREVVLRFPGDWWIAGVTQDERGQVVPRVPVRLWLEFPGYDFEAGEFPEANCYGEDGVSQDDGSFRFDVPRLAGYTLLASPEGRPASVVLSVQVDALHPRQSVALTLPDPSFISGRLLSADGVGLPGVEIGAYPGGGYSPNAALFAPQRVERFGHAQGVTDAQGRFRIEPLHPRGVYELSCRPDAAHPKRVLHRADVPAGTAGLEWIAGDAELVRGVVTGQVLSSETGEPVTDFTLQLLQRIGADGFVTFPASPRSDAEGRFRMEGFELGTTYGLVVRAEGWGAGEVPWWTASDAVHDAPVRLERPATLEIELHDGFGAPANLALVVLEARGTVWADSCVRTQNTDERGLARFETLDPGSYHVTATRGDLRVETELVVPGGAMLRARLDLHAP